MDCLHIVNLKSSNQLEIPHHDDFKSPTTSGWDILSGCLGARERKVQCTSKYLITGLDLPRAGVDSIGLTRRPRQIR